MTFKLLLGQEAKLFVYQVPQLNFSMGFKKIFPLYSPRVGPLGIDFGWSLRARVNSLGLSYDAYGLNKYLKSDRRLTLSQRCIKLTIMQEKTMLKFILLARFVMRV